MPKENYDFIRQLPDGHTCAEQRHPELVSGLLKYRSVARLISFDITNRHQLMSVYKVSV